MMRDTSPSVGGVERDRAAVHRWLRWYREEGLAGLADRSHRPHAHPEQTPSEVEAAVCELRRAHPRWGHWRLHYELGRHGCPGPIRCPRFTGFWCASV